MIRVTDSISLSEDEIEERFIRAPGPGGQNVNKVASAVQLRFDASASPALPAAVLERLRGLAGGRMTQDGVIVLTASRHRSQKRNRDEALQRLIALIAEAAARPKQRRPTRPSAAARRRALEAKKRRHLLKERRGRPDPSDD